MHPGDHSQTPDVYILSSDMFENDEPLIEQLLLESTLPSTTIVVAHSDQRFSALVTLFATHHHVLELTQWQDVPEAVQIHEPELVIVDINLIQHAHDNFDSRQLWASKIRHQPKIIFLQIANGADLAVSVQDMGIQRRILNNNELIEIIRQQLYVQHLERQNEKLKRELGNYNELCDIIGESPEIRKAVETVKCVMHSDVPVLVIGDSGTGKELFARCIHYQGKKQSGRFILLNGSILKGSNKAHQQEWEYELQQSLTIAQNGTLFLDEVDQLDLTQQAQVLERFFHDDHYRRQNIRIIAAASRKICDAVNQQQILTELYYRLSVVNIEIPALCQRGNDLLLLTNYFLHKYSSEYKRSPLKIHPDAIGKMQGYHWPGNVRELENRIRRAVIMNQSGEIGSDDLGFSESLPIRRKTLPDVLNEIQKQYLDEALIRTQGNVTHSAKELGISRMALYEMLNRFEVDLGRYRREN